MTEINESNVDGNNIPKQMLEWMIENIDEDKTIIELGSGDGSIELANRWDLWSIEDQAKYLDIANSHYIYAPLKDGWYDRDIVSMALTSVGYDVLLIDGPYGKNRVNIKDYLDYFRKDVLVLVDDIGKDHVKKTIPHLENHFDGKLVEKDGKEKKWGHISKLKK